MSRQRLVAGAQYKWWTQEGKWEDRCEEDAMLMALLSPASSPELNYACRILPTTCAKLRPTWKWLRSGTPLIIIKTATGQPGSRSGKRRACACPILADLHAIAPREPQLPARR